MVHPLCSSPGLCKFCHVLMIRVAEWMVRDSPCNKALQPWCHRSNRGNSEWRVAAVSPSLGIPVLQPAPLRLLVA